MPTDRRQASTLNEIYVRQNEALNHNDPQKAEALANELLSAMQQFYGGEHYNTAMQRIVLASALYSGGKTEQAELMLAQAIHLVEQLYGAADRKVAVQLAARAKVYSAAKQWGATCADCSRADSIFSACDEGITAVTVQNRLTWAQSALIAGDTTTYRIQRQRLLSEIRTHSGLFSNDYVTYLSQLCSTHMALSQWEQAQADAEEAELIADKASKYDNLRTTPLMLMAAIYKQTGQTDKARTAANTILSLSIAEPLYSKARQLAQRVLDGLPTADSTSQEPQEPSDTLAALQNQIAHRSYNDPIEPDLEVIRRILTLREERGLTWKSEDELFLDKACYAVNRSDDKSLLPDLLSAYFAVASGRDNDSYEMQQYWFSNAIRDIQYKDKDKERALQYYETYARNMARVWGEDHPYYCWAVRQQVSCYSNTDLAYFQTNERAMQLADKAYNHSSKAYQSALRTYRDNITFAPSSNDSTLRPYYLAYARRTKEYYGELTPEYLRALSTFRQTLSSSDARQKPVIDSLLLIAEQCYERGSQEHLHSIEYDYSMPMSLYIRALYVDEHDTIYARQCATDYVATIQRLYGDRDQHYYEALESRRYLYAQTDRQYVELTHQMLATAERIYKNGSDEYVEAVDTYIFEMSIGVINSLLVTAKDTLTARSCAEELVANVKRIYGEQDEHYYNALCTMNECYDYYDTEARPLREQIFEFAKRLYGKNSDEAHDAEDRLLNMGRYGHNIEYALEHAQRLGWKDMVDLLQEYGSYQQSIRVARRGLDEIFARSRRNNVPLTQEELDSLSSAGNLISISCRALGWRDSAAYFLLPYLLSPQISDTVSLLHATELYGISAETIDMVFDALLAARPAIANMPSYPCRYLQKASACKQTPQAAAEIGQIADWWTQHGGITELRRYYLHKHHLGYVCKNPKEELEWIDSCMTQLLRVPDYRQLDEYQQMLRTCTQAALYCRDYSKARQLLDELYSFHIGDSYFIVNEWPTRFSPDTIKASTINEYHISTLRDIEFPLLLHEQRWAAAQDYVRARVMKIQPLIRWSLLNSSSLQATDDEMASSIMNVTSMLASYTSDSNDAGLAYDVALLSKQLFLNAQQELSTLIMEHGDERMKAKLQELKQTRDLFDHSTSTATADSLAIRIAQLERQLASDSQRAGDFTSGLECQWQNVQSHLRSNEAAIEFVSYVFLPDTLYGALVITPTLTAPIYVSLPELSASMNSQTSPTRSYDAVWHPILDVIDSVGTLYFSPTGVLHQLPIEYAADEHGTLMSERFNMMRLSSTRQLTRRHDVVQHDISALLYGGISYDEIPDETAPQLQLREASTAAEATHARSACGSIDYLPGTLDEVQSISSILTEHRVSATTLTNNHATEESFKRLDGNSPNIIHIATHGFFFSDDNRAFDFDLGELSQHASSEDAALSNSGLLFCGAAALLGETHYSGEDGVLTARELSRLDLSHTDLVVLSACETAQGRVTGDGVFGLQRGFKKAGVGSLMMTLWQVDDRATQLLITEFYRNLFVRHLDKYKALTLAQHYLRTLEDGRYNAPKYWAAFILLDAI